MSVFGAFRGIFSSNKEDVASVSIAVDTAGTLQDLLPEKKAGAIKELALSGIIDGDDFTYMHRAFKSLEVLDLSGVTISGGRFVCGIHKNYYDLKPDELSAHSLHFGRLKSVTLPASVKNIVLSDFGSLDFGMCNDSSELMRMSGAFAFDLVSINVPSENRFYSSIDGILYNKEKTVVLKCPASHGKDVSLPATLKAVGANAFRESRFITSIEVPEGVTAVGDNAFFNCEALEKLSLPSTLKELGDDAFGHSFELEEIDMNCQKPVEVELSRRTNMANCKLVVPVGSESAYKMAPVWSDFKKVVEK